MKKDAVAFVSALKPRTTGTHLQGNRLGFRGCGVDTGCIPTGSNCGETQSKDTREVYTIEFDLVLGDVG